MKEVISTDTAPATMEPYSQSIKSGRNIFVLGQLPIKPVTGLFAKDIKAQTAQSINNVQAVLRASGQI